MRTVNAYAASEKSGKLTPFQYELPNIGKEEVDIKVHYCGVCHSDLSMLDNEWGMTQYPFVPGHEIVGEVISKGSEVSSLNVGDLVGLGWFSASCMHCPQCMDGSHHLCGERESTIVNRHGGFADVVRGHWSWAISLPKDIVMSKAGPLLCGGITVFSPIMIAEVKPIHKVGVIGYWRFRTYGVKIFKQMGL